MTVYKNNTKRGAFKKTNSSNQLEHWSCGRGSFAQSERGFLGCGERAPGQKLMLGDVVFRRVLIRILTLMLLTDSGQFCSKHNKKMKGSEKDTRHAGKK